MRALFVGDVHAKVEDLEDCVRLREYVLEQVEAHKPDWVVFLGDQYDAHAIKHVDVERFWLDFFQTLKLLGVRVFALVGNHDRPGNAMAQSHSMQVHGHHVVVVDRPVVSGPFLFLPYYHDPRKLVEAAVAHADTSQVLVCHAPFEGGKMDNGFPIKADAFYGKDVVNPDELPQRFIISGHIHKGAAFGKVWYPGSPRWQTMGDANTDRAIYLCDFDDKDGTSIGCEKALSTNDVCRRTWDLVYTPEDHCEKELALVGPNDKVRLNIRGPVAFCEETKKLFAGKGYRTPTFPTDRGVVKVSEAEGIPAAFAKHLASYKPKFGTNPDVLRGMLRERLHVG